jgi:hypothetical protein
VVDCALYEHGKRRTGTLPLTEAMDAAWGHFGPGFSLDQVKVAAAEDLGSQVAALFGPLVAVFGQDGADQADEAGDGP